MNEKETPTPVVSVDPAWIEHPGCSVAVSAADASPGVIAAADGLATGPMRDWLIGVLADAPHLFRLVTSDRGRLQRVLCSSPEKGMSELVERTRLLVSDEADLMKLLRDIKSDAALLIALADLLGLWPVETVTKALTDLADAAVAAVLHFLFTELATGGQISPPDPECPTVGSGYFVLAMGKHGARELNYSSDLDLVVFFEPEAPAISIPQAIAKSYIRLTQRLVKILNERTVDGYVFRIDLRLRPDPGTTPIAVSVPAGLTYYESQGQNWERAAFIKARCVAGDISVGQSFLKELTPFIWRRHLDYAAISDIHSIKRQIHSVRGKGTIAVAAHNVKLGRGGIREIEFFVQTQQLITGGRDPSLRGLQTVKMLDKLADLGWIDDFAADELTQSYNFLRRLEHRIQIMNDEQIHSLPKSEDGLQKVGRLCGFEATDAFFEAVHENLGCVQRHYASLFEGAPGLSSTMGNLVFTGDEDDPDTLETLSKLGFSAPAAASSIVRSWHHGRYRATRAIAARERLTECMPVILQGVALAQNPDEIIQKFDLFLARLPTGIQLFALILSNPRIIGLLVQILGSAPSLSRIVVSRIHSLDGLLEPAFFSSLPSRNEVQSRFSFGLSRIDNYEEKLEFARVFGQEQMVLIGARLLSGSISAEVAGVAYTDLAELIVQELLEVVTSEFSKLHGHVPGARLAIVAMGKLGGMEVTASSDLDLVVIFDAPEEVLQSDGPKALAPGHYHIRLTQRLLAAISAPTGNGSLYEVDLRLRPSGNKGPLAVSWDGFLRYHREASWTWEHMALTRARVIAGDSEFAAVISDGIHAVLASPRDAEKLADDIGQMRAEIARSKPPGSNFDVKLIPGGMIDVEFMAQYLQLKYAQSAPEIVAANTIEALQALHRGGYLEPSEYELLVSAMDNYNKITQITRMALEEGSFLPDAPRDLKRLVTEATGEPDFERLAVRIDELATGVRAVLESYIGAIDAHTTK